MDEGKRKVFTGEERSIYTLRGHLIASASWHFQAKFMAGKAYRYNFCDFLQYCFAGVPINERLIYFARSHMGANGTDGKKSHAAFSHE